MQADGTNVEGSVRCRWERCRRHEWLKRLFCALSKQVCIQQVGLQSVKEA
jgi:hypothetical protein